MTSNFVFRGQKTNGNLDATLDFLIYCQKANNCFETTLKISHFVVKEWMAVWVQLKIVILLWKTNGRLGTVFKIFHFAVKNEWLAGYNCKSSYFAVKKRIADWVHALNSDMH